MTAIAEFERDLIRDRVIAGVRRARAQGRHLGRPRKHHVDAERARPHRRRVLTEGGCPDARHASHCCRTGRGDRVGRPGDPESTDQPGEGRSAPLQGRLGVNKAVLVEELAARLLMPQREARIAVQTIFDAMILAVWTGCN